MNRLTVLLLLFIAVITATLPGCNDLDDNFSTDPNHKLKFSVDTLLFDTVFTTISSATKQFMIYNPNSKPLNISTIQLAHPEKTGFRINVDGQSGKSFNNISILEKDSMYIFIEVTVDPTDKDQPVLIEDYVEFLINGKKQSVLLQAYGQDVHIIKGGYIFDKDTTLSAQRPYLIYDSIMVNKDITVSIEKGASFYMHNNAKWIVSGTIKANGTLEHPILFRGDRFDKIIESLAYDQTPGQWQGMTFRAESFNNIFDHVTMRNGVNGLVFEKSTPDQSKMKISNSRITTMDNDLLNAVNCNIEVVNSELSNARGYVVSLTGGSYEFIHCTLVNKPTVKGRMGECLNMTDSITINKQLMTFALEKATFENCIIDGSYDNAKDSLGGELNVFRKGDVAFNYTFRNCVVKTKKINNPNFINVQYAYDIYTPMYKQLGTEETKYIYNYSLAQTKDKNGDIAKEQIAIGKADRTIAEKYPIDLNGVNRLESTDGVDIGAYEYVPDPEKEKK